MVIAERCKSLRSFQFPFRPDICSTPPILEALCPSAKSRGAQFELPSQSRLIAAQSHNGNTNHMDGPIAPNERGASTVLRMQISQWCLSLALQVAPRSDPETAVLKRHLKAYALEMERRLMYRSTS